MLLHQMLKQKNIKGYEISMSSPLNVQLFYSDELYYILYHNDVFLWLHVCKCVIK